MRANQSSLEEGRLGDINGNDTRIHSHLRFLCMPGNLLTLKKIIKEDLAGEAGKQRVFSFPSKRSSCKQTPDKFLEDQNLGSASQFIVDFPAPMNQVHSHELGPVGSKDKKGLQESVGPGPSKTARAHPCTAQRHLLLLGTLGVLAGAAVGVWFLAKHLLKPLPLPETPPLQDTQALLTRCRDVTEEEEEEEEGVPFGTAGSQKVSFRVNRDTFLLEVQTGGQPSWLLVCHDSWDVALGTWICRQLGHVRLTHHKGVNLTDVKVNNARAFAQLSPNWKGNIEDVLQIRSRCPSGRVVALKCSECGSLSKGRSEAPLGHWPWGASLHLSTRHVCAGSVLSREWIITAAHCVYKQAVQGRLIAHVGIKEQMGTAVEKVLPHPRYGGQSRDYNIAMLKLKEPLNFSETSQAICLPWYHQTMPTGSRCWIAGRDFTGSENAQAAEKPEEVPATLISTKKCNSSCAHAGELTAQMLCASYLDESIDACQSRSSGSLHASLYLKKGEVAAHKAREVRQLGGGGTVKSNVGATAQADHCASRKTFQVQV
ncbi:transmembrane protease serine 5 [Eublepharis macularius]|uniref:Transmembrane protease serine 5 n=1 Tax=Eublepharis macularius TaxID=481883 RepID=A0AA97LFY6_EUBMA|nr:transmembrane protease serine 5 [Eublepharis macularius]